MFRREAAYAKTDPSKAHGGVIGKVECPRIEILHSQTPSSARLDTPNPADVRRPSHDPHLFISTAEFPRHRMDVWVATTG